MAKNLAAYLIATEEKLANRRAAAVWKDARRTFRVSFKKGYAFRVAERAMAEIHRAKQSQVRDPETGTALMVVPLYDQTKAELDKAVARENVKVEERAMEPAKSASGFYEGFMAGNAVALSANLIERQEEKKEARTGS